MRECATFIQILLRSLFQSERGHQGELLAERATVEEARADIENLELIAHKLHYPLTIFVNVDASITYAEICPASITKQTVCFAVQLKEGTPLVTMQNEAEVT